jgi:hypothetical protein
MRFEEYRKHDAISLAEGTDDGAGRAPSRWSSFQPISGAPLLSSLVPFVLGAPDAGAGGARNRAISTKNLCKEQEPVVPPLRGRAA